VVRLEKQTPIIVLLLISILLTFTYIHVTFLINKPPKIKEQINWKGTITERYVGVKSGNPVLTQTGMFTADGQIIGNSQGLFQKWEIIDNDEATIKLVDKNGTLIMLKYDGYHYHGYIRRPDRSSPNTLQLEVNK